MVISCTQKSVWCTAIGEELPCKWRTICCGSSGKIGSSCRHVPRKISSVCSKFLRRDRTTSCKATGSRRYSEDFFKVRTTSMRTCEDPNHYGHTSMVKGSSIKPYNGHNTRAQVAITCACFYFADLIFVDCQSTTKTTKIGSLENFQLDSI